MYQETDRVHRYESLKLDEPGNRVHRAWWSSSGLKGSNEKAHAKSRRAMMIGKYRLSGQWRQTWSVNIDADCTLADSLSLLNHSELSICPTSLNARFRIFHRDFSSKKRRNTVACAREHNVVRASTRESKLRDSLVALPIKTCASVRDRLKRRILADVRKLEWKHWEEWNYFSVSRPVNTE